MSRRDANQYNILNTVNTGVADRLNPQSLQDSSNELQKQLFDKLELSNFLEPFTLKVATDSIKGSKNGLGAVWAHMYDAVKNKNIMANSDVFRSLSRNLPSGVAEGALRDLQSGGPRAALAGAVRRTLEAAQRGEIPAVNNVLDLIPPEAQEALRAGRSAVATTSQTAAAIQRMATTGGDGRASLLEKSASQLQAELVKRNPEAAAALQESLDNASASASAAASRASAAIESPLGTATAAADNASQTLVRTSTRTLGGVERAVKINPDLLPEDDGSGGLQQSAFEALGGEDGLPSTQAFDELIRAQRRTEGFGADEAGGSTQRSAAELENFKDSLVDDGRPESWASTAFRKIKNVGQFFDRRIGKEFGAVQPLQVREGQLIVNPADSVLGESIGPRPLASVADDPVVPDLVRMADRDGGTTKFDATAIMNKLNLFGGREPSVERALPTEFIPQDLMNPDLSEPLSLRPAVAVRRLTAPVSAPKAELVAPPDRLSELRTAGSVDRSDALQRIDAGVAKRRLKGRDFSIPEDIETKSFGDVKRAARIAAKPPSGAPPALRLIEPSPPAPEAPVRSGPITTAAQADALFASDDEEDEDAPAPKPRALKEDTSGLWKEDDVELNEPDSTFDLEGFQRNEANRIANAKSALDRDFPENMFDDDEEEEAAEVVAPNVVRGGGSSQDVNTLTGGADDIESAAAAATTTDEGSGGADSAVASTLSQLSRGGAATTADEAAAAAATTTDEAVSSAAATTTDEVASSGAATLDQVIGGAATGFAAEQVAGGLEGIDVIPVLGDVAGVLAGLGGALAVEFLNKPEASPVEHIRNVVNVASEFGSSQ